MPPSLIPPPYRTLEAVRGIASVAVVFFHATLLMSLAHPAIASIPGIALFTHGYLGVQVFFVVSGYCIASAACSALGKPRPVSSFAWARVRRIFPPCWASLALIASASLLASWLVAQGKMEPTSLSHIDLPHQSPFFYFTNLTLTQLALALPARAGNGAFLSDVCWTLCYELAFYLITGIVLATLLILAKKNRPAAANTLLTLLHVLTLVCGVFLLIRPTALIYPFDLWPQFGLGVAVFDVVRTHSRRAWLAFIAASLLISAFLFCPDIPIGQTQQSSRATFSTALLAALLLLACHAYDAALFKLRPIRLAAFVGTFSYSLYLINFFLIAGLMILYKRLSLPEALHFPAIFLIVALVLPVAYLFFRAFEKPFLKSNSTTKKIAAALQADAATPSTPASSVSPVSPVPAGSTHQ